MVSQQVRHRPADDRSSVEDGERVEGEVLREAVDLAEYLDVDWEPTRKVSATRHDART